MIKELIRQIKEHIMWFFEHPLKIVYISKSFLCYLWKGYSYLDLWDVDYYLMKTFNNIIDDFIKKYRYIGGYPEGLNEEEWITLLNKSKEWSKLILEDDYKDANEYVKLEEVKQQWLCFIFTHFFDLWI